jgi:hypothetical protein
LSQAHRTPRQDAEHQQKNHRWVERPQKAIQDDLDGHSRTPFLSASISNEVGVKVKYGLSICSFYFIYLLDNKYNPRFLYVKRGQIQPARHRVLGFF